MDMEVLLPDTEDVLEETQVRSDVRASTLIRVIGTIL